MDQRIEDLRERLHKKRAEVNNSSVIVDPPHRKALLKCISMFWAFPAESYERRRPGSSTDLCTSRWGGVQPSGSCVPLHPGSSGGKKGCGLPPAGWPTPQTYPSEPHPLSLRLVDSPFVKGTMDYFRLFSIYTLTNYVCSFLFLSVRSFFPHPFHVVEWFVNRWCFWWLCDYRCLSSSSSSSLWWWWCCFPLWSPYCCFWHITMLCWRSSLLWSVCCRCLCGGRGHTEEDRSGTRKPSSQWKVSDLDIILSEPIETWDGRSPLLERDSKESEFLNGVREAFWPHARCTGESLTRSLCTLQCVYIMTQFFNFFKFVHNSWCAFM